MISSKIKQKLLIGLLLISTVFASMLGTFNKVSAVSTEIVQTRVDVVSTTRDKNTIKVVTKDEYTFENCTYAIIYEDEGIKISDLLQEQDVTQVDSKTFSFNVDEEVLGVVVYKIGYWRSSNEWTEKFTEGNIKVGDTDSEKKKTWISVTTDSLVSGNICNDSDILSKVLDGENCDTYYMFYFNLDMDIDDIIDVDFKYKIKTVKKDWVWSGSYEETSDWIRVSADKDEMVPNYTAIEQFLESEVSVTCGTKNSCYVSNQKTFNQKYKEMKNKYIWPVLDKAQNDVYAWRIQPLKDLTLTNDESWGGAVYTKQYFQEMAIVEMSFYAEGEYYEDIAVLDENTGEVIVEHDLSWLDKIKEAVDWIFDNWWKVLIGIAIIFVAIFLLIKLGIKIIFEILGYVIKGLLIVIWFILKWTIFLPITLIVRSIKRKDDSP